MAYQGLTGVQANAAYGRGPWGDMFPYDLRNQRFRQPRLNRLMSNGKAPYGLPGSFGPTTVVSDDFNRANAANLGAAWDDNGGSFFVSSNTAEMSPGGLTTAINVTNVGSADCWGQGTIVFGGSFDEFGILLRATNAASSYYIAFDLAGGGTVYVRKRVSFTQTTITTGTISLALGTYVVYAEIVGNTVTAKLNGVTVYTGSADGTYTAEQKVGLAGAIVSSTTTYWDNFTGGKFSASPSVPPGGSWGMEM